MSRADELKKQPEVMKISHPHERPLVRIRPDGHCIAGASAAIATAAAAAVDMELI